jgi:hypothetical protein
MIGRTSNDPEDFARRVALAERVGAVVLTDIKTGAAFPTKHPLHPFPPSLYVTGDAARTIVEADVIVSLDWIDLGGTLRQACGGDLPRAQGDPVLDGLVRAQRLQHGLPGAAADGSVGARAARCAGRALVAKLGARGPASRCARGSSAMRSAAPVRSWRAPAAATDRMPLADLARRTMAALAAASSVLHSPAARMAGEHCDFRHPLDYVGFDGGGGSAPAREWRSARARASRRRSTAGRGTGRRRLPDGPHRAVDRRPLPDSRADRHREQRSFFNDELHQERMARVRGRPVENRWIGLRLSNPTWTSRDLRATRARKGYGPVRTVEALDARSRKASPT